MDASLHLGLRHAIHLLLNPRRSTPIRAVSLTLALNGSIVVLGAFMLYLVQPNMAKMNLPMYGGGDAVWSTCML
jgi:hypothetical protein